MMLEKGKDYFNLFYSGALTLLALLIVVWPKLSTLAIILVFLIAIVGIVKKHIVFKFNLTLLFLALLYVAYLVGVLFTENQVLANRYIENKLSFIIFPIIFSLLPKKGIDLKFPILGLLLGVILTIVLGLIHAISLHLFQDQSLYNSFFAVGFSYIHHPTYFSVFITLAMYGVFYAYKMKWIFFNKLNVIIVSGLLLISLVLCLSFAGILFFIFSVFTYITYLIYKRNGSNTMLLLVSGFLLLLFSIFYTNYKFGNKDTNEITHLVDSISDYSKSPSKYIQKYVGYKTGNEVRLIIWTATFLEIVDHPLGVGTGNIYLHMSQRLKQLNQDQMVDQEYNPHNQFLQTFLEIGFFGFLILMLFLVFVLKSAYKNRNVLLILCYSSLIFNSFFESMLQRQSGIVFFSFWICLLVSTSFKNEKI